MSAAISSRFGRDLLLMSMLAKSCAKATSPVSQQPGRASNRDSWNISGESTSGKGGAQPAPIPGLVVVFSQFSFSTKQALVSGYPASGWL